MAKGEKLGWMVDSDIKVAGTAFQKLHVLRLEYNVIILLLQITHTNYLIWKHIIPVHVKNININAEQ